MTSANGGPQAMMESSDLARCVTAAQTPITDHGQAHHCAKAAGDMALVTRAQQPPTRCPHLVCVLSHSTFASVDACRNAFKTR